MAEIPIVDFKSCGLHRPQVMDDDIREIGGKIVKAFQKIGFVYLINTGIRR